MSCANFDYDQTFCVHDFGPKGHVGTVKINLTEGLQYGGVISAVLLSANEVYLNIHDDSNNILMHMAMRTLRNVLDFQTQTAGVWGRIESPKNTVKKGKRASVSVVYEASGYRVFVNGKQQFFFKHRFDTSPSHLEILNGQVFKVICQTSLTIIP